MTRTIPDVDSARAGETYGAVKVYPACVGYDTPGRFACLAHDVQFDGPGAFKWHIFEGIHAGERHVLAWFCERCQRFEEAQRGGAIAPTGARHG